MSTPNRLVVAVGISSIVARLVLEGVGIARLSWTALIQRLPDDAFYYLEIGRRAGRGEGFTFDGINETNGFHPLWQLLLMPVSKLFAGQSAYPKAALVLALFVLGLTCALAIILLWRLAGPLVGVGAVALAVHSGALQNESGSLAMATADGMESAVVVLTILATALALARCARNATAGNLMLLGVVTGLTVMARIDFVLFVPIIAVALALRIKRWRSLAWWSAGGAAVAIPFLTWWVGSFGRLLSTSASVKTQQQNQWLDLRFGTHDHLSRPVLENFALSLVEQPTLIAGHFLLDHGPPGSVAARMFAVVVGLAAGCGALAGGVVIVRDMRSKARSPLSPEAWAILVTLVAIGAKAVFDRWNAPAWAYSWYAAPVRLVIFLAVGALAWRGVRAIGELNRPAGAVATTMLALLAVPLHVPVLTRADNVELEAWKSNLDAAADWVLAHPPQGRIGGRDSGLLGYRLESLGGVVNLDGLVSDYEFGERVNAGQGILELAGSQGVEILITRFTSADSEVLSCGEVLWRSEELIPGFLDREKAPLLVVDIRSCEDGSPSR